MDQQQPSNSKPNKPQPNTFNDRTPTIGAGIIINDSGTICMGINNIQLTMKNEPPRKLMFQVKNPIEAFTGRESFLDELHNTIQKCGDKGSTVSIISQTITGLGGIGKSETVRMYIKMFSDKYDNVVWIDAEKPSEAIHQFTSLAFNKLHLNTKDHNGNPREFKYILEDIYEKLCEDPKLLLIVFDNAEALDDNDTLALGIRQFLPQQTMTIKSPVVLITSRQQYWEDMNVIILGLWEMEECIEFIYKRLRLNDTPDNKKDATELAELFGRLPIAIELAASVIAEQLRKRRVSGIRVYGINNLIAEYKAGDRNILRKKTLQNSTHVTMQLLLNVTLDKIKVYEEGKLAMKILAFMAYLSPTKIPKKMIHSILCGTNEHELDNALTLLADYSIIQSYETHFTIHRVFQDIVITILPSLELQTVGADDECVEDTEKVRVLDELTRQLVEFVSEISEDHEDYNDIVTNIVHVMDYIIQNSMISKFYSRIQKTAELIEKRHFESSIKLYMGLIKYDRSNAATLDANICENLEAIAHLYGENGVYGKALDTFYDVLQLKLSAKTNETHNYASKKTETLRIQTNIALCLDLQGKHEEALQLYYSVEKDQEKVLGPAHPDTLLTKMNIAKTLSDKGKIDEALQLYYSVEKDQEKVLGPAHPDTLLTKIGIANRLSAKGKFDEALQLYYSVEKDQEKVLGPAHPDTLRTRIGIANRLSDKGKFDEALQLYYSVEKDQEKVLRPAHPDTLNTKMNIATILRAKGKIDDSLQLCYSVEKDQEKVLGPAHPDTLNTKMLIANRLGDKGRIEDALQLYYSVKEDQEKVLGALHESSLLTKINIANSLSRLGKKKEALQLYLAVFTDVEEVCSPLNYLTLVTKSNIAVCVAEQSNFEEAIQLFNTLQKEQEKVYSCFHPNILTTKMNTANCLTDLGKTEEALILYDAVEKDMEKELGLLHYHTLLTKMNKAKLLSDLGKKEESLILYRFVLEEQEKIYGPLFPYTMVTKMNTAVCLSDLGKKDDALKLYYKVAEMQEKVLGPEHPHTLLTKKNISSHLSEGGTKEKYLTLYFID